MMINTMRGRLVLSHVLPLLVMVPLMGIALIYVLETRVLLEDLSTDLMGQALLVAEIASGWGDIWTDRARAQQLTTLVHSHVEARIVLLDVDGCVVSSSDPLDVVSLCQPQQIAGWTEACAGQVSVHTAYSRQLHHEIVDVLVPVVGPEGQVAGVVRLSHRLTGVYERFVRLRYLIGGILLAGLLLGGAVGWVLALNMERPLEQVTHAVDRLIGSENLVPLPEVGPHELQALARSVNTLVAQLHGLEQSRRQLLANLVHELGRPLGALRSAVQALLGGADQDQALRRDLLVGIEEETDRLRRLVDDLAGLRDQISGTLELDRRSVALGEWLAHTLGPWREAAQDKGLKWQAIIPSSLPVLDVDPDRLGQALGNLLSNAVRYTPSGGTVSVGAGVRGAMAWIQVSDTGPGIAPGEQERVFEPLYRSPTSSRFPQGMGLGLSIARSVAIAHGGRLELDSTPGVGSRFTILVPLSMHTN
jgi:two-component system sensor histidine kinase BaeS